MESASSPASKKGGSEASRDDELTHKIGSYISECINRHNQQMGRAHQRYFSWFENEEKGPTGRERNVYGLHSASDPSACRAAVDAAAKIPPKDEARERLAARYVEALEAATPVINEANRYYDQSDYKDDDFAKGKELHPRLLAVFRAFGEVQGEFSSLIHTTNRALAERRIERLAEDPRHAKRVIVERAMLRAEDLVTAASDWDVQGNRIVGIELEPFTVTLGQYEGLVDELSGLSREDGIDTFFRSSANNVLKEAKELMRRIRDDATLSSSDMRSLSGSAAWMVRGAPPRLIREYNSLVDRYNSLRL